MTADSLALLALVNQLEAFILATIPDSVGISKYGGTLYTLKPDEKEGQYCGLFMHKTHVQLSFSQGAQLSDPSGLLSGGGKYRRHINFSSADEINFEALGKLIHQAAAR